MAVDETKSPDINDFVKQVLRGNRVAVYGDGHCMRRAMAKIKRITPGEFNKQN